MSIRICVSGVTGWTGSAVAKAVLEAPNCELVGAVAREAAGQDVGSALGVDPIGLAVVETVAGALAVETDVLIDYTHPGAVKGHVEAAIQKGVGSVVGTSGLTGTDYEELDAKSREAGIGIIAAGNFSITAALAKHFAGIAARHIPHWEILDYSHASKPDVPSGTAQELAEYLGDVAQNELGREIDDILGPREARGASIGGSQVHSIRLPSYVLSFETVFGLPNERLSIRHDSGSGAEPYVNGTLMAAQRVVGMVGLVRGLDTLLFADAD